MFAHVWLMIGACLCGTQSLRGDGLICLSLLSGNGESGEGLGFVEGREEELMERMLTQILDSPLGIEFPLSLSPSPSPLGRYW